MIRFFSGFIKNKLNMVEHSYYIYYTLNLQEIPRSSLTPSLNLLMELSNGVLCHS